MANILLTLKNRAHSTFACLCLAPIFVFVGVNFWLCLTPAFFETETNRPTHLPPNLHAIMYGFIYRKRKIGFSYFSSYEGVMCCVLRKKQQQRVNCLHDAAVFSKSSTKNNHRLTCIGCKGHEIYFHTNNWDSLKSCCFCLEVRYTHSLCVLHFCLNNFSMNKVPNMYRPFVKIIIQCCGLWKIDVYTGQGHPTGNFGKKT